MFPVRLCLCIVLVATCSARPNWHKGVIVVDDSTGTDLRIPQPFVPQTFHEAQLVAAQAIRNAEENSQLQLAMLKERYMDIVRQNTFNAFAPHPLVHMNPFHPKLHSGYPPANEIRRQPVFIHHIPQNPCAGNIFKCLIPNTPNRFGKIVPPTSAGLQPCIGPNCNPLLFKPHTLVFPKPTHSSNSKKPSKRPHKHHLCHRKQPHRNCIRQSTFWPTYSTVKLNTKLSTSTSMYPSQEVKYESSVQPLPTLGNQFSENVQQHFVLPGEVFDKTTSSTLDQDNKHKNFETLKTNISRLEHEILGTNKENLNLNRGHPNIDSSTIISTSEDKHSPSKNEFVTDSLPMKSIPTTLEAITDSIKYNSQSIPPLKTLVNLVHGTPTVVFHTNDVIVGPEVLKTTKIPYDSFEENNRIATSFTGDKHSDLTSVSTAEENSELRSSIEITTLGPISEYYTSLPTDKATFSSKSTSQETHGQLPERKSGEPRPETFIPFFTELEPTTSLVGESITTLEPSVEDSNAVDSRINMGQTTLVEEFITEKGMSWDSLVPDKREENEQTSQKTTTEKDGSQIFNDNLRETTPEDSLYQRSSELIFQTTFDQYTTQSTFEAVPEITVSTVLHHQNLGREEGTTDGGGKSTVEDTFDSLKITKEKYTPQIMLSHTSYYGTLEETTLQHEPSFYPELRELFSTTEGLVMTENIGEEQEDRLAEISSILPPNNQRSGMDSITNKDYVEPVTDISFGENMHTPTYSIVDILENVVTHDKQEAREENSSESLLNNSFSTVNLDDIEIYTKSREDMEPFFSQMSNSTISTRSPDFKNSSEKIESTISLVNIKTTVQNNKIDEHSFTTNAYANEEVKNEVSPINQDKYIKGENNDKQSKTNDEDENYFIEYPLETTESWTTYKNNFTWDLPQATETISNNYDIPFTENRDILVLTTEENENPRSFISVPFEEHMTTDGKTNKVLQPQESNEEEPHELAMLPKTIPELSTVKDVTETYEAISISDLSVTVQNNNGNTKDRSFINLTELPEFRENMYGTTEVDYTETEINLEHESSTTTATTAGNAPQPTEITPEKVFWKTGGIDLISEDWTEESTVYSLNLLTDNRVSVTNEYFNYPQSKVNEEEYTLEVGTPFTTEVSPIELLPIQEGRQEEPHDYLPDTTTEISPGKGEREFQEVNTTPNLLTESDNFKTTDQDQRLSNSDKITTMKDYSATKLSSDIIDSSTASTEERFLESNLNLPEVKFGNTDMPGLLIGENWINFVTEYPSTNNLIEVTDLVNNELIGYPQYKSEEEEIGSKHVTVDDGESTVELFSSTQTVNVPTLNHLLITDDIGKTFPEINEATSSVTQSNDHSSFQSYQSGVLKFTSEIETTTEKDKNAEESERTTNNGLSLELNDNFSFKRRMRSAQGVTEEITNPTTYPTTECVFCMLGLPHGHKVKRAIEDTTVKDSQNIKKENKALQGEKFNSSSSNLEDVDSSKLYASTILELLPVIREGYKNDAFSEEDKKAIRSLFGDMKSLIDEHTFEKITETTSDLLMGDGATQVDDSVEVIDYDSSEGMLADEIRLKRSKKLQVMNNLLKKFPYNSEKHYEVPPHQKLSRHTRSSPMSQAEAGAILALLTGKETVEFSVSDEDDDEEYEFYDYEEDEYEEDSLYGDGYEDDYDEPSIGELIRLARKHRERKAMEEKS